MSSNATMEQTIKPHQPDAFLKLFPGVFPPRCALPLALAT